MTAELAIGSVPIDHRILLAVQGPVAGLVAEKKAQQAQIDGLVAERGILRDALLAIVSIGYDHEVADPAAAMLLIAQLAVGSRGGA